MEELLKDYDKKRVDVFINYLEELKNELKDGKPKNWWFKSVSKLEFAGAFKKVASEGLFIDGDTVTLNYLKKLVVTYDYHAYQNKVKAVHPDTIFDFGLVYEGDKFSFSKESGRVVYNHEISNPFNTERVIIGAYGVIKNKTGEFLETISTTDIKKMQKSSKMGYIWKEWFDRMVLKSIVKRICKVHFKDVVKGLEEEDNEQYDMDLIGLDEDIIESIENCKTIDDLSEIYTENNLKVKDKKVFMKKLSEKKESIKKVINEKLAIIESCKIKNVASFLKYLEDQKLNYFDMSKSEIIDKAENYDILELNV